MRKIPCFPVTENFIPFSSQGLNVWFTLIHDSRPHLRSWSVDWNPSRHHPYWRIVFQICRERIPILSYTAFRAMEQSVATGSLADFYPGGKLKLLKRTEHGSEVKETPCLSARVCTASGSGTQLLFPSGVPGSWGCLLMLTDLFLLLNDITHEL